MDYNLIAPSNFRSINAKWVFLIWLLLGCCTLSTAQGQSGSFWSFSKIKADANNFDYLGQEVTVKGIANAETELFHEHFLQVFIQTNSAGMSIFAMNIADSSGPGDTPEDLSYVYLPRYYLFLLIGGLALLSLLVFGIFFLLRRQVHKKTGEIQKTLDKKEVLLREIHHRVKNSLAIISGLIGMQLESTESDEAKEVLMDSQSRIHSMAMIHEKLYETESLSEIKLDNYLRELVEAIHSTFTEYKEAVDLRFDLESIELNVDKVIPCGLLINELVVNAFKHAFQKDQQGVLEVKLHRKAGNIKLTVADNGPGLPEDFSLNSSDSLGSMLISTFAAQLEAETRISNGEGAAFTFSFLNN